MRKRTKLALIALPFVPLLLLAALRLGLLTPFVNLALRRGMGGSIPLQVRVGQFRSDVLSFAEADNVVVLTPVKGALMPLLTINSLRLEYLGWQAWQGRLDWDEALRLARVRGLFLYLLREPGGDWNLSGLGRRKDAPKAAPARRVLPLPATRLELEDSQVVLSDEGRDFRTSISGLEGTLDTRALPLVVFSVNGRTDDKAKDNLSLAGELDRRDGAFYARLDLADVELAQYINYFLPPGALRFTGGRAGFSVRLRQPKGGDPVEASGRAELSGGTLNIPAISVPLQRLSGVVVFDQHSMRFRQAGAHFLGADWRASGSIQDLRHPSFDLALSGTAVPLAALSEQVKGLGLLALSGSAEVGGTLTGPARKPLIEALVSAADLGVAGAELQGVSASARLQGGSLEVQDLRATLWGGSLSGSATMDLHKGGKLKAQLSVEGASLQEARLNGRRPLPLSGTATAKLKAGGLLRSPDLQLTLAVPQASLGSWDLGSLNAKASWDQAGLDARFDALHRHLQGRIAFSRGPQAEFHHSSISCTAMELSATAAGLASAGDSMVLPQGAVHVGELMQGHLAGLANASMSLEGPLHKPQLWIELALPDGHVYLPEVGPLALKDPKAGVGLKVFGSLGLHAGDLQLGRGTNTLKAVLGLRKTGGLEVQALGHYPLHAWVQPGHLALAVDGDLRLLDALELFDNTQGRLSGDFLLSGSPDAPQADGSLKLKGFQTVPTAYLAPVSGGEFQLDMKAQNLVLSRLKFQSGGLLSATGGASLAQGLKALSGQLELRTDDQGLRIQNWDRMGEGSLQLSPVDIAVDGPDSPLNVSGRLRLSNAVIRYAGAGKPAEAADDLSPAAAVSTRRPVALDLQIGLGANVWYEKQQTHTMDLLDFNPLQWGVDAAGSYLEGFRQPDMYFRLAPTDEDFIVQGTTPEVNLHGELSIDRGRVTIMEDEFQIKPTGEPARITFNGRHAEVRARAVGRLRYTRDDPTTHRPFDRTVDVTVDIKPMDADALEKSDLSKSFLNFQPSFSCDPVLVANDQAQNQQAIFNLIVLGDPQVDDDASNSDASDALGANQIDRLVSAEARKQIAKISAQGFKMLGSRYLDVFRVVPRFKFQAASNGGATSAGANPSSDSPLVSSDWTLELGKSLGDKFYASFQGIRFGDSGAMQSVAETLPQDNAVLDYGARAGLEYQVGPSRSVELYYNYAVTDDLDPIPYNPSGEPKHGPAIRFLNTIHTDNYSPALSQQRRWETEQEANP